MDVKHHVYLLHSETLSRPIITCFLASENIKQHVWYTETRAQELYESRGGRLKLPVTNNTYGLSRQQSTASSKKKTQRWGKRILLAHLKRENTAALKKKKK